MSLDDDKRRAERAHHILNDDLVIEAFNAIEVACLEGWRNSDAPDADKREEAWRLLRALDAFRDLFKAHIENGKFADAVIAKQQPKQPPIN
jgi:hypothetical protein